MCALTETYETQQGWERSLEGGMIDIETRQWARKCHREEGEREGGRERKGDRDTVYKGDRDGETGRERERAKQQSHR